MEATRLRAQVETAIRELDDWGRQRDWVGSDPYEGMNATRAPAAAPPIAKRALIQAVKRSPVDLRPLLGIAPRPNAAALAHVCSAYSRLHRFGLASSGDVEALVGRLAGLRTPGFSEPCWGYHFDVQTRFFFYGSETPNTIATAFAGEALLDAHEAVGVEGALELAVGAGGFFLRRVPQTGAGAGAFFGYLPGDRTPIHNASLLAAGLLARLAPLADRDDFSTAARRAVEYALAHQRPDGSWPYAETPQGDWVDGFHTGYVLDRLASLGRSLDLPEATAAYERGLRFYADRLVTANGAPKYFADSLYPIDGQSVAQAIRTFALAAVDDDRWLSRATSVFRFALAEMRRKDGSFIFQRTKLWSNRTPHMRWVQAPMLEALSVLRSSLDARDGG